MEKLAGWGRCPVIQGEERLSENLEQATRGAVLCRGLGRSYGDSSLPPEGGFTVAGTRLANRLIAFDENTGVLRAEAGLSLASLNALLQPRGWTTPVSPGTENVTLGGMVAADVHGKNHHLAGCFGEYVTALCMRVADGRVLEVTEQSEPELFRATLGGMGLTGHILQVEIQLERIPSPWIWCESERVENLDAIVEKLREASREWPFTACWVDTLTRGKAMGRGILLKGRWATPQEAPAAAPIRRRRFTVPFEPPEWVLGRWSVRIFNEIYFRKHVTKVRRGIVHPHAFFYPLDFIDRWDRIYGRRGLVQHQCVLPPATSGGPYHRFFEVLTGRGGGSFLSVLKDFGAEGRGMLSFPRPGLTIAIDLPMRGERTQALVDELNELVIDAGGRIYLAKDALTRPEHFRAMEPRLDAWNAVRRKWDPDARLRSAQSIRLLGDPP